MTIAPAELDTMAHRIAESATRSDIEVYCVPVDITTDDSGKRLTWFDTKNVPIASDMPSDREFVDEAVAYLDARGLLIHREDAPHIVTFR